MADKIVDVNTDNLDDFGDLFHGKATAPEEQTPDPVEEVVDTTDPEDDSLAEPETSEETEAEAEEAEIDSDPEEKKPAPKKKTVQERINELTAKAREAERREAELAKQLEELRAEKEVKEPVEEKTPVAASGEPDPDAVLEDGSVKYPLGEYDPQYIRDLMKFTLEQERIAAETQAEIEREAKAQEERQAELNAQAEALKEDWSNRVQEVVTEVPDFVEKVQTLEETFTGIDPAYGEYLATTIMSMDAGTDVLYYLSNNLEEAQRIADLGPVQATIALGRIEAKFDKGESPKQPKVSKAPEPPAVRLKGSNTVHKVSPDTDDLEAFEKEFFRRK